MLKQKIKLIGWTSPFLAEIGGRNCYNSFSKHKNRYKTLSECYKDLIPIAGFGCYVKEFNEAIEYLTRLYKRDHNSVLEHVNFTFIILTSRAVLQQLARHRHISLSVRSTRYTLKQILKNPERWLFKYNTPKHLYDLNVEYLKNIADFIVYNKLKNDDVKHLLPENLLTHVILTVNLRELLHIIKLRADKHAWLPFQEIALLLAIEIKNKGFGKLLPYSDIEKRLEQVQRKLYTRG